MDHFDQVHQIYTMLKNARLPVSKQEMKEKLEVSASTVKNRIAELRDRYDAPIKYSHRHNGYYFEDDKYELKGIWFSQNELFALLTLEQQLETLEPGLISEQLKVFKNKIIKLIQQEIPEQQLSRRLRILSIHNKQVNPECFELLAKATLLRQQLDITHQRHADQRVSRRIISPQRLVYYKANWYVDAWCHQKQQIRTFAMDAILSADILQTPAKEVSEQQLEQATSPSYGIFAGNQVKNARLVFSDPASHWVSREKWHSEQQGCWLDEQRYQLIVPYQHDEELVMDILKYGEWVTVEEPVALQQKIRCKISAMQKNYQ
jgi:predicted DNA-binding transcriptional regulator YafY